MDLMTKYQVSVEYAKKEFSLGEYVSLYELVNTIVDKYRMLKENQTTKEPEDGTRTESRRKRKQAS